MKQLTEVIGDREGTQELLVTIYKLDFQYPQYQFKILSSTAAHGHIELALDHLAGNMKKKLREMLVNYTWEKGTKIDDWLSPFRGFEEFDQSIPHPGAAAEIPGD